MRKNNRWLDTVPKQTTCVITVDSSDDTIGFTIPSGSIVRDVGTVVHLQAIVNAPAQAAGWVFNHWIINGESNLNNPCDYTLIGDTTAVAYFSQGPPAPTYATLYVDVSPEAAASTVPAKHASHTYPINTQQTFAVTQIESGYVFNHWTILGIDYTSLSVTVTIDRDGDATAYFDTVTPPPSYSNVTISVQGSGTIDPAVGNYSSSYLIGSSLYITATPATGWHLLIMRRNGVDWTSASTGELLDLQATESIEVIFEQDIVPPPSDKVHIYYTFEGIGQAILEPSQPDVGYDKGTNITITATPTTGYVFSYIRYKRTGDAFWDSTTSNPAQFNNIQLDYYMVVVFEVYVPPPPPPPPSKSTVTITVEGQGTTDPAIGTHEYDIGSSLYVTATSVTSWHLKIMQRNGVDWTNSSPGEFLNLQTTEAINVVFEQDVIPPPPPPPPDNRNKYLIAGGIILTAIIGGFAALFGRKRK